MHALDDLESDFGCGLLKVLESHFSWQAIHEIHEFDEILQSLGVFNIWIFDVDESFSEFRFQNHDESLDLIVDLLLGDTLRFGVLSELRDFGEDVLIFRLSQDLEALLGLGEHIDPLLPHEVR